MKAPGTKRLKLKYDTLVSSFGFNFNLRRFNVVPSKKPAPDIYLLAATTLGVNPARCVVVEDTRIGVLAGRGLHSSAPFRLNLSRF